ncbi:hypothetical protein ACFCZ2_30015 [Streptomyces sp. NPDC056202]|uniref:hypothetical protein n=1 Tax=unclassified Streptomyces TaxID=2593676 RepID=UPI0035E12055
MPEDLLNQQARTIHDQTAYHAQDSETAANRPSGMDQPPAGAGTGGTAELMARQAEAIRAQVQQHSTEDFMQRLAARIATGAGRPARIQYTPAATANTPSPYESETDDISQLPPPAPRPDAPTERPGGRPRPRARRTARRRPTPIIASDPVATRAITFGYVTQLCTTVLRSNEIDTLNAFAADYDAAGARTFGCLLYSLDKRESALYWWRFAAGAGDPLAAHLLAAHHAAIGPTADARAWRAYTALLGFTPEQHVPQPVRHRTELAEGFGRELPMRTEVRHFMRYPRLPTALVAY